MECKECKKDFEPYVKDISRKGNRCRECYNKTRRELRERQKKEGTYKVQDLRKYRPRYKQKTKTLEELSEKEKLKRRVRWITRLAIRKGLIIKKPCNVCGHIKSEAHHADYYKPLEIIWLCKKHHLEIHNKILRDKL